MVKRKITWTKKATRQFNTAIEYIRQDSDHNAEKVKEEVLDKIGKLSDGKIVHRKDPYKKNNDASFLYFEIVKLRIVYQVHKDEIIIIRIRHTGMEPKPY